MPLIKIWVHLIWATKNKQPLLTKDIRQQVFKHICKTAQTHNIYIDFINGHLDHIHCLILLNQKQSIHQIIQLIKDESATWISENNITQQKFEWQDEFLAVSFSELEIDRVREYIKNQESHHQKKSFDQEYEEFIDSMNLNP